MKFFSQRVSEILAFSREEATRLDSPAVYPEHLLLGILRIKDGPVRDVFCRLEVNTFIIKRSLEAKIIERQTEIFQQNLLNNKFKNAPVLDESASNILKLSVLEAKVQHKPRVEEQHLLLAILHDRANNGAKEILEQNNMEYEDVLTMLGRGSERHLGALNLPDDELDEGEDNDELEMASFAQEDGKAVQTKKIRSKTPVLDNFGIDLTDAALEGKLDPVVGREKEMARVVEILCRRKKNNPILIGEPGVGKSAIVEGLAQLIATRHSSPVLFNRRLIALDMAAIVAGTKYRGQFEERLRTLIKEIEQNPNTIVFIDEIHTIIGAGNAQGSMDAANILKPALARGRIQCIGATTLNEYRNSIEKDGALERRFQKVLIEPTSVEESLQILNNIKERYEQHHRVRFTSEAIKACVTLTQRYVNDRSLPDKAIDALDETGARVRLSSVTLPPEILEKEKEIKYIKEKKMSAVNRQNFELAASYRDRQTELEAELVQLTKKWEQQDEEEKHDVTEHDVAEVVSMMTGVSVQRMTEAEGIRLKGMFEELRNVVVAQDDAINKLVKAIRRSRTGLKSPNRPIGAFMFLGPTGVGKTHLAKKLAEFMFSSQENLIRIDMSEYTESFNVSRLIGAPPGYVGFEEGGQLTERVRRHPYSIVLLDEIEKAHGNVYNLLLQVLDEGRLTDSNGRYVDFRNTVIIMTSNAGTKTLKEFARGIGFSASRVGDTIETVDKDYARSIIQKALGKQFSPEFLNRLDEIITFDQLDLDALRKIVDIEIKALVSRIEEQGYTIDVKQDVKDFLATKGYDVQFGARPLKRAIQTYIEDGLSEMIVNSELSKGDVITVEKSSEKDELTFKLNKKEK